MHLVYIYSIISNKEYSPLKSCRQSRSVWKGSISTSYPTSACEVNTPHHRSPTTQRLILHGCSSGLPKPQFIRTARHADNRPIHDYQIQNRDLLSVDKREGRSAAADQSTGMHSTLQREGLIPSPIRKLRLPLPLSEGVFVKEWGMWFVVAKMVEEIGTRIWCCMHANAQLGFHIEC